LEALLFDKDLSNQYKERIVKVVIQCVKIQNIQFFNPYHAVTLLYVSLLV